MNDEIRVLKDVVSRLEGAGVPYMLSGSMAMLFYGAPRLTRDLDIVIELREQGLSNFIRAFSGPYYLEKESIRNSLKSFIPFNLIHDTLIVKIDFIVRKNTAYRVEEFFRRQKKAQEGFDVWVVAPEDLILSKMEWSLESGSEIQDRDIKNLLQALPFLDKGYIEKWSQHLGMLERWKKLNSR